LNKSRDTLQLTARHGFCRSDSVWTLPQAIPSRAVAAAFAEMKRKTIKRALLPLSSFCRPERFRRVRHSALGADKILDANSSDFFMNSTPTV
jgi:hypothetical protein